MAFNVKNEATLQLARELAAETGSSIATVIDEAVRARHEQVTRAKDDRRDRILRLAAETGAILRDTPLPDHGTLLYDDAGLPR